MVDRVHLRLPLRDYFLRALPGRPDHLPDSLTMESKVDVPVVSSFVDCHFKSPPSLGHWPVRVDRVHLLSYKNSNQELMVRFSLIPDL